MATEITQAEKNTVYTGVPTSVQFGCGVAFFVATATAAVTGFALLPSIGDYVPDQLGAASCAPVEVTFRRLLCQWQAERQGSPTSDLMRILTLRPYLQIIALGPAAIPSILAELQARPHHWWLALEAITGENPVPPSVKGNLKAIRQAWLDWGHARRYV